ncbi:MAG: hypothetical protein AAFP22_01955 [Planctomycetota bacterium]
MSASSIKRLFEGRGTYARARLRLGILGVTAYTGVVAVALALGLPHRLFGTAGGSLTDDASLLALWLLGVSVVLLPLEYLGGVHLPRAHGRKHHGLGDWILAWLKGSLTLLVTLSFAGALVVLAGRFGGRFGAVGMFGLLAAALIAAQEWLALLVGDLRRSRVGLEALEEEVQRHGLVMPKVRVLESNDEAFTGGITGLPTAERSIIPLAWVGRLEPAELGVLLARRITIVDRGLRALGLAAALGWVLVTFALSTALPGAGVATVAGLLQTSLWFTLLQALGLLVLPTPSRAATRAADAWCLEGSDTSRADLDAALVALDELGDRELDREPFVERWFHPVASVASRRSALEDPKRETAPWHVARAAVYLALVGLSPLARLVHGSVGRPDVWVLLPTDG